MAGQHDDARDGAFVDDDVNMGGKYVDSEIPGDARVRPGVPAGEYVESEIPGDAPVVHHHRGAYDQSEIPGDVVPEDEGVGHYVDSDIPGESTTRGMQATEDAGADDDGIGGPVKE